jgi:hypothetical protein
MVDVGNDRYVTEVLTNGHPTRVASGRAGPAARASGLPSKRQEKNRLVILAASTVAIVAIAAVVIIALIALIYIVPRGGRRRR